MKETGREHITRSEIDSKGRAKCFMMRANSKFSLTINKGVRTEAKETQENSGC